MISKLNDIVSKVTEVVNTKSKYGKADPDCPPNSTPADIANPLVMWAKHTTIFKPSPSLIGSSLSTIVRRAGIQSFS